MDTFDGATYGTEHVQMNKHWKVLAFKLAVAIIFEVCALICILALQQPNFKGSYLYLSKRRLIMVYEALTLVLAYQLPIHENRENKP